MSRRRIIGVFVAVTCLPAATVIWLGVRLLEQDRNLQAQHEQESRQQAADRAVRFLHAALSDESLFRSAPDDGAILVTYPDGERMFRAQPAVLPEAPQELFRDGETLEFGEGDPKKAAAAYRSLTNSRDAAVRAGAWLRLARSLRKAGEFPGALAAYDELSHVRSNTMPLSPFAGEYEIEYQPTLGLPGTTQVYNVDVLNEDVATGQQGTQMDDLGHFGSTSEAWDGASTSFAEGARYFGGFTQKDVKPTSESPLLKLGMDKIPPIVTTAILLDARKHVGQGKAMKAGEVISAQDIEDMIEAQGLADRGILPGDVVLVYTGWSDHYRDPDTEKIYYSAAPGFAYDAAEYLGRRHVVAAGLDTPFVDPIAEGQLSGESGPPSGVVNSKPFAVHEYFLTQAGMHTLENLKLREIAQDGVALSCAMILPLRIQGGAGSPIRPVAIGSPR